MVVEAEVGFPSCLISFLLLLPHVCEHYHEERLGNFCWLTQAVFRPTFCAFRLTADSILWPWLFLLVSRNCSGHCCPPYCHHALFLMELRLWEMLWCLVLVKTLGRSLRVVIENPPLSQMSLRNGSFSCLSNRVKQSSWRRFFWPTCQFMRNPFIHLLFLPNFTQVSGNSWFVFSNILYKLIDCFP